MSDDKTPDKKDFEFPSLHEESSAPAPTPAPEVTPTPPSSDKPAMTTKFINTFRPALHSFLRWFRSHRKLGMVVVTLGVGLFLWGISALRHHGDSGDEPVTAAAPDEIPVNAVEVRLGRFQDDINAVGTLKGEAEIELRFEVDGTIADFPIAEGAKVRKGQLIAKLSDRDAQLKVQRAKIELEQLEKLYSLGGVSKTKLDESRLNLDVAQTELDKTRILASRDGILGDKSADVGEFVTPQRKVATLVAIKNVVVEVGIIEKQIDKVFPGQKIMVNVDAYPGNVFDGKIETISPLISPDGSKTFSIRAKIPNPDSLLLPGMFARSRIITFEVDDAVSVPNDALIKTAGGFQVFVVNAQNTVDARDVAVGYVATEATQIKEGLNPGEVVVVQRPPELKAGSKVKIIEVQK